MAFWTGAYFVADASVAFKDLRLRATYPELAESGTVTATTYRQLMDMNAGRLFDLLSRYNTYALDSLGTCLAGEDWTAELPVDFVARGRTQRESAARLADQTVADNMP
jgi:hypothetical protein